jgi:hypothetical protein
MGWYKLYYLAANHIFAEGLQDIPKYNVNNLL